MIYFAKVVVFAEMIAFFAKNRPHNHQKNKADGKSNTPSKNIFGFLRKCA